MKEYIEKETIQDLINTSLENVKSLMETNTIVGIPIEISNNVSIIPISKVSVGFVAGGGEYSDKSVRRVERNFPKAGATGGGMTISPVGFLVNMDGDVKFVDVEDKTAYQTTINLLNKLIGKIPTSKKEKEEKYESK